MTLLRLSAILLATLFGAGALILAAFAGMSSLREVLPPGTGPGEQARHATVDGLNLHYRQWGPDDGPPVVLVHGAVAWSETWRDIATPLGDAGYRVLAPDLPPFGYSERPVDADYSRPAQARLLQGFAEALRLDDFILVGHSFGGGATMEAALAMREKIDALVLIDVALNLSPTRPKPLVGLLLKTRPTRTAAAATSFANPIVVSLGLRSFVFDKALATNERLTLYHAPLDVEGTAAATGDWIRTGLFGDLSAAPSAQRDNLAALDIPTLVVWGREDTVTPLEQGEDIAGLLPDARLVILDAVNHIPHIERPDLVVEALLEFLLHPGLADGDLTASTRPIESIGEVAD
ncbi:MAG: alpha/beta hydrolase [Rhizobiaceae bacterium]|nr:alpha/beta hydrolase [Rhizobiaceae bacterium]